MKDFNQIDWDSMTFSNNLVFLEVMKNKELCKHLIEHVLHIHIREILYLETDKSISVRIDSKRIRLDVYVKDVYIPVQREQRVGDAGLDGEYFSECQGCR